MPNGFESTLHRVAQLFPLPSLALRASCSSSLALRTTERESVSWLVLSTAILSAVAIFSNSALCLAISCFCAASLSVGDCDLSAWLGVADCVPGGVAPGEAAGAAGDCAWLRSSPTPAVETSAARHVAAQTHPKRRQIGLAEFLAPKRYTLAG